MEVDTRGLSIRGHLHGRRIWVGEVMEGYGTSRHTDVRGVISFERPLSLGLHIHRKGRAARWIRRRGPQRPFGDLDLDRLLQLHGDDESRVKALLTPSVRQTVHTLVKRWNDIVVTDEDVQVWLTQPLAREDELQDLIQSMLATAEALEAARLEVAPPTALEPLLESWEKCAHALNIRFEPWLPGMSGDLDGRPLRISARREGDGYAASLSLGFQAHPPLGLLLRPQTEPDGYWSVGQDIQVGEPAFDAAFVIKGWHPGEVVERLNPQARSALFELQNTGLLTVDDRGIVLRLSLLDAETLVRCAHTASQAAKALGW